MGRGDRGCDLAIQLRYEDKILNLLDYYLTTL